MVIDPLQPGPAIAITTDVARHLGGLQGIADAKTVILESLDTAKTLNGMSQLDEGAQPTPTPNATEAEKLFPSLTCLESLEQLTRLE